jgi:hypothetical protein
MWRQLMDEFFNEELEVASKEDRVEIVNKEFWSSYRKRYDEEISRFRMEQNISLQRHLTEMTNSSHFL